MTNVRPHYVPAPYQDSAPNGRLILRDGTTAVVRPSQPSDRTALCEFFAHLSFEARRQRFFSLALPSTELIDSLCDSSQPNRSLTLIVTRLRDGASTIIATASYT